MVVVDGRGVHDLVRSSETGPGGVAFGRVELEHQPLRGRVGASGDDVVEEMAAGACVQVLNNRLLGLELLLQRRALEARDDAGPHPAAEHVARKLSLGVGADEHMHFARPFEPGQGGVDHAHRAGADDAREAVLQDAGVPFG